VRRLVLVLVVAAGLAGIVVPTAAALRFETGDCYESSAGGIWVCPKGTVGSSYGAQLKGAGGCGPALPYQYRVLSGSLPPGISLSSSGAFGGTPTTAGTYEFWVELSDQDPPSASWCAPAKSQRQFRITINPGAGGPAPPPPPPPLVIETSSVPTATVGASYSTALKATPSGTQTWEVTGGTLPQGLTLGASTGVIDGTPATEGSFAFTVTVSDTNSRSAKHDFHIDVRAPLAVTPLAPQGAEGGLPSSEVGVPWSAKLDATGGSGRFTWSVAAGGLPDGVGFNPDGTVTGTPHSSGRFGFTVRVADDEGRTATLDAIVTVAPTLAIKAGLQLHAARPGHSYRAKITTFGGVGPVKWTLLRGTLPRGVRLAQKLGVVVGTPRRSPAGTQKRTKTYRFTVQATDALGVTSMRKLALVVSPG
jgi:hypothetical protein